MRLSNMRHRLMAVLATTGFATLGSIGWARAEDANVPCLMAPSAGTFESMETNYSARAYRAEFAFLVPIKAVGLAPAMNEARRQDLNSPCS